MRVMIFFIFTLEIIGLFARGNGKLFRLEEGHGNFMIWIRTGRNLMIYPKLNLLLPRSWLLFGISLQRTVITYLKNKESPFQISHNLGEREDDFQRIST